MKEFSRALFVCAALSLLEVGTLTALGQTQKKVVRSEADLPRFNYPIPGTATQLLTSDDTTFNAFAEKVRRDVDSVLNDYDIEDHATMRGLLGVKLNLEILAGQNQQALATIDRLRAVQDKPDAKLTSGLLITAMIDAEKQSGETSGSAYEADFQKDRSEERRVGKECRSRWSPYH